MKQEDKSTSDAAYALLELSLTAIPNQQSDE